MTKEQAFSRPCITALWSFNPFKVELGLRRVRSRRRQNADYCVERSSAVSAVASYIVYALWLPCSRTSRGIKAVAVVSRVRLADALSQCHWYSATRSEHLRAAIHGILCSNAPLRHFIWCTREFANPKNAIFRNGPTKLDSPPNFSRSNPHVYHAPMLNSYVVDYPPVGHTLVDYFDQ